MRWIMGLVEAHPESENKDGFGPVKCPHPRRNGGSRSATGSARGQSDPSLLGKLAQRVLTLTSQLRDLGL